MLGETVYKFDREYIRRELKTLLFRLDGYDGPSTARYLERVRAVAAIESPRLSVLEPADLHLEAVRYVRDMLDGANKELAHREEIDLAQRMRITFLENQLRDSKPLAVLPPLTVEDVAKIQAKSGTSREAPSEAAQRLIATTWAFALSRLQPAADPEYVKTLEDGIEAGYGTLKLGLALIALSRTRLAAGKEEV